MIKYQIDEVINMKDKKVIFMGTPSFAVNVLESLIKETNVLAVVTQPDKEVGRKRILTPPPVKEVALKHNIKVLQPRRIREEYQEIIDLNPDIIITCAYGQMIPKVLIDAPLYNIVNVHASLLPNYRGGAPIQRAIMNGEKKTGITIMKTDEGMDTGPILKTAEVVIEDNDNYDSLSEKLSVLGAELLIDTLPLIFNKEIEEIPQDEKGSIAKLITKEDEHLNFFDTAVNVRNKVRALSREPGAYFNLDNERIKVYDCYINDCSVDNPSIISNIYKDGIGISTLDKEIVITRLQVSGKKEMSARDYLNGKNKENLKNAKIF